MKKKYSVKYLGDKETLFNVHEMDVARGDIVTNKGQYYQVLHKVISADYDTNGYQMSYGCLIVEDLDGALLDSMKLTFNL